MQIDIIQTACENRSGEYTPTLVFCRKLQISVFLPVVEERNRPQSSSCIYYSQSLVEMRSVNCAEFSFSYTKVETVTQEVKRKPEADKKHIG